MAARGKCYKFRHFEFWPENGRIYLLDTDRAADSDAELDDQIQTMSPADFMARAIAIRQIVQDTDQPHCTVRQSRKLLEEAVIVCKLAKKQGDPTDPETMAYMARHRRSSQILMPGTDFHAGSRLGLPPPRYKLPKRDPDDIMRRGAQVTPDLSGSQVTAITPALAEQMRRNRRR